MNPCSEYRELITHLASDALNTPEEKQVRQHLEGCANCRTYLAEISHTVEKLTRLELRTDIETSENFHRRVIGKIRSGEQASAWRRLQSSIEDWCSNWRVALPVCSAAVALLISCAFFLRQRDQAAPAPSPSPVTHHTAPKSDLEPTIYNYQAAANRSLDKFDELLTQQANKTSPPAPIYTASSLKQRDLWE